jgi:NAD(P)-dependent dehydrogenase (short-subunit alcohol dehydrogenase family)
VAENKVSYEGQVVVITGAARGIGAATARLISARGGKVFALDIARNGLLSLQKELGLLDNQISTIDLGNQDSVKESIDAIFTMTGRIDALINTAGVVGPTNVKVEDMKWEDFENTLRINLFGTVWLTQAVIPYMKSAKYGRIAHVASIAGKEGNPGMTPYNVSKSGMIGFIKGVSKEIAPDGITINALAPAVIRTPMNADTSDETLKYMISRIPMGRVGEAEEVAELLAFMGSGACSFTTGFTFDSSGGRATY